MTNVYVSSGVTSSGLTVSGGEQLVVLSGGYADVATVSPDGAMILSSGAEATSVTVSSGGVLSGPGLLGGANFDAGLVSGVVVGGFPPSLEIQSGGSAS